VHGPSEWKKLKFKSKKKSMVESQVNFYPSSNYFYKTQSEVGIEKADDSEVANRQVREVKNHRNNQQRPSSSTRQEKDPGVNILNLDDCHFDIEGKFLLILV
jgi:hypothetical protein